MRARLVSALWVSALSVLTLTASVAHGETGYEGWLRYPRVDEPELSRARGVFSEVVLDQPSSLILSAAAEELSRGCSGLLGVEVPVVSKASRGGAIVLKAKPAAAAGSSADGFSIQSSSVDGRSATTITGNSERGTLYGAFALLRRLQTGQSVTHLDVTEAPSFAMRMANQWDNPDGSIERGYGGSVVFDWSTLPKPDPRHKDLARLLASVGYRYLCINNVNADTRYLSPEYLKKIAAVADTFRPYGIQLFVAISFDSPRKLGKLKTADPLDPSVRQWWKDKTDDVYRAIPDLGGYLIKADSEGRPGPYAYGRDHADGANVLAEALLPHNGIAVWRAFVYKTGQTDRFKAAYDTFKPLDGKFAKNVILQVKHGPFDFQVREPVNPLFGAMPNTNLVLEVQAAQEYTGQAIHLCYLAPMWREVFDFDTQHNGPGSTVAKLLSASSPRGQLQGVAAVTNMGDSQNWAGHPLAMSNVYAIGRMSWDRTLSPAVIAEEWTRMTFGNEPLVVRTISGMLTDSRSIYESYTSPLGLGVLHDVATHFSPAPEKRFRFHKADDQGIGVDRTAATGSGYVSQYAEPVAKTYEKLETTPEDLLLYFHHVPYGYVMKDGRTLVRTMYDLHERGAKDAEQLIQRWTTMKGLIDDERFEAIHKKLIEQAKQARIWCDAVNGFFEKQSGVPIGASKPN